MSHTPQYPPLARIEHRTIIDMLKEGKRMDDRPPTDYRELEIECGVIEKANGSAQVNLGKTKIMVGVKVELGEPFADTPDHGVLTVNAELVPLASPSFEPGPPGENAIELARVVDRGIRESNAIDLKSLCLIEGKKVLVVFTDIYVLDHDGNLIDASGIAALTAILNAKINKYEVKEENVEFKDKLQHLPIQDYPIPITIAKTGDTLIVDPCLEEEHVAEARLSIAVKKDDSICAIQKGWLGTFTNEEVKSSIDLAIEKSKQIRKMILAAVKE